MQPAVHQKPIRLILEVQASDLQGLVLQILERFTTPSPVAPPRPTPDPDDADADEPEERTADPPAGNSPLQVADIPPMPVLPPHVAKTRVLGKPCAQGHSYEGSAYCLRKRSNRGCVQCERDRDLAHKQVRQTQRRAVVTALPPTTGARPELPPHLALTAFLSPITCTDPTHRYRGRPEWTLRFLDTEDCAMCVTQQSQLALAGD